MPYTHYGPVYRTNLTPRRPPWREPERAVKNVQLCTGIRAPGNRFVRLGDPPSLVSSAALLEGLNTWPPLHRLRRARSEAAPRASSAAHQILLSTVDRRERGLGTTLTVRSWRRKYIEVVSSRKQGSLWLVSRIFASILASSVVEIRWYSVVDRGSALLSAAGDGSLIR